VASDLVREVSAELSDLGAGEADDELLGAVAGAMVELTAAGWREEPAAGQGDVPRALVPRGGRALRREARADARGSDDADPCEEPW
jgi:hypothetical protein